MLALFSLSFLWNDSWHTLSAEKFLPQNGRSSSVYFSEEIVSLFGISPPPALPPPVSPLFLTLHILERTEWASLFIGPLKDLLKGSAMNGWWGWGGMSGWVTGRGGGGGGLGLYAVCSHSGPCHTSQRQGGRVVPLYQHATAGPGSCISHAWPLSLSSLPLLVQGEAQSEGLSSTQSSIGSKTKSKEATS